jgi:uncharacterized protein YutE (UPF0331/DUF86 family)
MNDAALIKKDSVERCVRQIRAYYAAPSDLPFEKDFMKQDAIAANLQRACELCIDLANMAVRAGKLGLPKSSAESFEILERESVIPAELCARLMSMTAFRNILVHQYSKINLSVMVSVIESHLDELTEFAALAAGYAEKPL